MARACWCSAAPASSAVVSSSAWSLERGAAGADAGASGVHRRLRPCAFRSRCRSATLLDPAASPARSTDATSSSTAPRAPAATPAAPGRRRGRGRSRRGGGGAGRARAWCTSARSRSTTFRPRRGRRAQPASAPPGDSYCRRQARGGAPRARDRRAARRAGHGHPADRRLRPAGHVHAAEILDEMRTGRLILVNGGSGICNAVYVDDVVTALLLAATTERAAGRADPGLGPGAPDVGASSSAAFERMLGRSATVRPVGGGGARALGTARADAPGSWRRRCDVPRGSASVRKRLLGTREAHAGATRPPARLAPRLLRSAEQWTETPAKPARAGERRSHVSPSRPWVVRYLAKRARVRIDKATEASRLRAGVRSRAGMRLTEAWARWAGLLGLGGASLALRATGSRSPPLSVPPNDCHDSSLAWKAHVISHGASTGPSGQAAGAGAHPAAAAGRMAVAVISWNTESSPPDMPRDRHGGGPPRGRGGGQRLGRRQRRNGAAASFPRCAWVCCPRTPATGRRPTSRSRSAPRPTCFCSTATPSCRPGALDALTPTSIAARGRESWARDCSIPTARCRSPPSRFRARWCRS